MKQSCKNTRCEMSVNRFLLSRNFETYKCKFNFNCKYIPRIGANVNNFAFLKFALPGVNQRTQFGQCNRWIKNFKFLFKPTGPLPIEISSLGHHLGTCKGKIDIHTQMMLNLDISLQIEHCS